MAKNFKSLHTFSLFFFIGFLLTAFKAEATIPESCNCQVDTVGYANYVTTLTIADVPMQFHVHNTFAVAIGYINTNTPNVVQNLINNHPNVTTIVLLNSGGSDDDTANLQASQMLRNAGYKMYLPSNGEIASGAVDMFFAGTTRVIDAGAMVGVHSWGNGTVQATDFPVGHAYHLPYINYYVNMGLTQQESEAFYYFTINAAPAASIYWMLDAEIDQYKLRTCKYAAAPTYTVSIDSNMTMTADLPNASYQWIDCANNNPISGATQQSFTPTNSGNYAVIVTESGCSDTSACASAVISSISTIQPLGQFNLSLYPNPVQNLLTIDGQQLETDVQISIQSINGAVILNKNLQKGSQEQINTTALSAGIYYITIRNATTIQSLKFIKL